MKSIGKYQVVEELGGSATGETYRARDAFRNREFAVKILRTVPGISAEAKGRFCGHLASCAELTHRHIAKIHDLGEVEEGIFIATEWRTGMDLRRFIDENRDLPLDQKLAVMAQVAEGLAFAHSRGIAHGDLKPSNIVVDAARDVSILDFGIAKWLAALVDAGTRPEGMVVNYLAPEQVLGNPFDARSDIFALGLMLYEFVCGKYPFLAEPGLIPREIVHSEAEPLCKLDAQLPEVLERLVARALLKDPEQRLQNAEEFASGLYLAAQQLRRVASAAAAADLPAGASMVEAMLEPMVDQLPPALTAQPAPTQPALASAPLRVRERPQDAEPEPQPWTARSYAAVASRPPVPNANPSKQPVTPAPAHQPPDFSEPPAYHPPQSFLRSAALLPPAPPPRAGKMTKRMLAVVVGLILAAFIVSSLISRQNLRASQNKDRAVTPITQAVTPVEKPSSMPAPAAPESRAPKREEPAPDHVMNPEISARQMLNGPVRTLWESGRYAEALTLVNQVLTNDPDNEEARAWKKRIRDAQAAEAALK